MSARRKDDEIVALIKNLGSHRKADVENAKVRLTIIGARAVEYLIEVFDQENCDAKQHAIAILALIRDTRAKGPLMALLLERNPKLRSAAARALANFPSPEIIRLLERLLSNEKNTNVRLEAIHSLVDIFRNGDDGALSLLLETIFNRKEKKEVRIASLSILPFLKPKARKALIKKLRKDVDAHISAKAAEFERSPRIPSHKEEEILYSINMLGSQDYEEFNTAIQRLIAIGTRAIDPLIREMVLRSHDAEFCNRASMVLKGLEPANLKLIIPHLKQINEALPMKILIDVVGSADNKTLLYSLKELIDRINADRRFSESRRKGSQFNQIKARAHLQLAKAGSRLAIDDLNRSILERETPLDLDLLSSFEYIGKKEELPNLFKAYSRENGWARDQIRRVFLHIMKRERIRRTNRIFRSFEREAPAIFKELFS